MAASVIVVWLFVFRARIALLVFVVVRVRNWTLVTFTVFIPFMRFYFWALIAASMIIIRLALRANVALAIIVVSLTFLAFVAGVIIIVRQVFRANTLLLLTIPYFWLNTVLTISIAVNTVRVNTFTLFIFLVPDKVAGAFTLLLFLIPNTWLLAFSAFSFTISVRVFFEAFTNLIFVIKVFSCSIVMIIALNTFF
jgi:hypothetical protein